MSRNAGRLNRYTGTFTAQPRHPGGETESDKMRTMLKLMGFDHGWQMVSGFAPEDDFMRTQRIAFEMHVAGERVTCEKQYTDEEIILSRDPGRFLAGIGAQMRHEVAWGVMVAARPERDYIRQAIEMYERPGMPFLWAYARWLARRLWKSISRHYNFLRAHRP